MDENDQPPENLIDENSIELSPVSDEAPARPKWYWTKRLQAGNPFYLISAALLLFGINRLSVDPSFLGAELPNLIFNFSALQIYEVLLVTVLHFWPARFLKDGLA